MSQSSSSNAHLAGTRIGKKFAIGEKIGSGSFGDIFAGTDLATGEDVAIKIEKNTKRAILRNEAKLLNYLSKMSSPGIARLRWYGMMHKYNIMVTDLLGKSLEKLFVENNYNFTLKTVIMLADQMIKRLEYLHSRNIIHRDIKPDNFLMGEGKQCSQVFLIDFGLSKVFKHRGMHIPFRDGKSLTGTLRYASVFTHMGYEQSRRDDLECLGYVLIYFLKGSLPWQGMRAKTKEEKYRKVADMKKNTPVETLCMGIPSEFVQYVKYCRSLGFTDRPDYKYLRKLFQRLFKQRGYAKDYIFDWTNVAQLQQIQQQQQQEMEMSNYSNSPNVPNTIPSSSAPQGYQQGYQQMVQQQPLSHQIPHQSVSHTQLNIQQLGPHSNINSIPQSNDPQSITRYSRKSVVSSNVPQSSGYTSTREYTG